MSENSFCNYCTFKRLKDDAKAENSKLIIRPCAMGGIYVFRIPKNMDIPPIMTEEFIQKYMAAWFMELPDHCCC